MGLVIAWSSKIDEDMNKTYPDSKLGNYDGLLIM